MPRHLLPFLAVLLLVGCSAAERSASSAAPESIVLVQGDLRVEILPPDAEHGYYRGPRFDWSGMVRQATWRGHTAFGELKTPHDPLKHDHAPGPAEEFGMNRPLGYEEAGPEGLFPKIGVGLLRREAKADAKYFFNKPYQIVQTGTWTVQSTASGADFEQVFAHQGWGWRYRKRVELRGDGFALVHRLENTGARAISTDFYNHNMIQLDGKTVGSGWKVAYDFPVEAKAGSKPKRISPEGQAVVVGEDLPNGSVYIELALPAGAVDRATVTAPGVPFSLTVASDLPPERMCVYGERRALCPETFSAIEVAPGSVKEWTLTYAFAGLNEAPAR